MNGRKHLRLKCRAGEAAFFALIRAAFSQRRKTAANAIANGLQLPKATRPPVLSALRSCSPGPPLPPEQLTLKYSSRTTTAPCKLLFRLETCFYFSKKTQTRKRPGTQTVCNGRLKLVTGIEPATC